MTWSSPLNNGPRRARGRRSAFTLTELLVVMSIMVVLMALLLPALASAWKTSVRARMAADIQTICTALELYHGDWQQYPQVYTQRDQFPNPGIVVTNAAGSVSEGTGGAYWLCRALVGPGNFTADGAGPDPNNPKSTDPPLGWRNTAGGKIWGPYLAPDSIKMGDPTGGNDPNFYVLLDRKGHPILYYPGKPSANIYANEGYCGTSGVGMFNPNDNAYSQCSQDKTTGPMSTEIFMTMMGDVEFDGKIEGNEVPVYVGNYILWSAGPDEKFGPVLGVGGTFPGPSNPCDDVTNFPRDPNYHPPGVYPNQG